MQAKTGNTTDRPLSNALATRSAGLRVSSSFIRREAARAAADAGYAELMGNRYAILRTRVLQAMRNHGWHRLAVVPLTAGAGGSTVAVNLALTLSRQKRTEVILADLDLGKPAIATVLGIPGCDTVSEVLQGGRQLIDITAVVEEAPNLWVMAPASPEPEAAELLQDEALAVAMGVWRSHRPEAIEVIDSAPLLGGDAALATLPLVDAILLVADGQNSTAADMAQAERLLKGMPPVMGVVLNKAED